jgi:hypothetical protein
MSAEILTICIVKAARWSTIPVHDAVAQHLKYNPIIKGRTEVVKGFHEENSTPSPASRMQNVKFKMR